MFEGTRFDSLSFKSGSMNEEEGCGPLVWCGKLSKAVTSGMHVNDLGLFSFVLLPSLLWRLKEEVSAMKYQYPYLPTILQSQVSVPLPGYDLWLTFVSASSVTFLRRDEDIWSVGHILHYARGSS